MQRACLALMGINDVVLSVCERLSVSRNSLSPASSCCLIRSAAGSQSDPTIAYNYVDIYDVITGSWSTAQLSVARYGLTATSVGNVALFAGGIDGKGALLCSQIMYGTYGCVAACC